MKWKEIADETPGARHFASSLGKVLRGEQAAPDDLSDDIATAIIQKYQGNHRKHFDTEISEDDAREFIEDVLLSMDQGIRSYVTACAELAALFVEPYPVDKPVDFGKHSQATPMQIAEIDPDYCRWAVQNVTSDLRWPGAFRTALGMLERPTSVEATPIKDELTFRVTVRGGGTFYDGDRVEQLDGPAFDAALDVEDNRSRSRASGTMRFRIDGDGVFKVTTKTGSINNHSRSVRYLAYVDGTLYELDSKKDAVNVAMGADVVAADTAK